MFEPYRSAFAQELSGGRASERILGSPQGPQVTIDGQSRINLCSNNYLGLAGHPAVVEAAHAALDEWGPGMASVRFISGTQELHTRLEARLSQFHGTDATILYNSGFDANTGLFETLLDERDAVISDELNHASIIDGIRLCRAQRHRYANRDLSELERCLQAASGARRKLVVTDGVFSMDGYTAPLDGICALAEAYEAIVVVDDAHGVGVLGTHGHGTTEQLGVQGRVDLITGTLGKSLGGASGGYVAGPAEVVELLRARSRPYLFSNSLAPPVVAAALVAIDLVERSPQLLGQLHDNAAQLRSRLTSAGLDILEGAHPIVPIMLGDADVAVDAAQRAFDQGVFVTAFHHPVVPRGKARIRTQVTAAHSSGDIDRAAEVLAAAVR